MDMILEVPDLHLIDHDATELAGRIKLYAALLMFQSNELSAGAATELAGVDRLTFATQCQRFGIQLVNYPAEDLSAEMAALGKLDAVGLVRGIRDGIHEQTKDMSAPELIEFFGHRTPPVKPSQRGQALSLAPCAIRHSPESVPQPVGSYSLGVELPAAARILCISGQIPEAMDGTVPPAFDDQCNLVWDHIFAILRSAQMEVENIVKVTTFLTDRDLADANGRIRRERLGAHAPALTVIVAQTLDPRWLLEIEVIAAAAT